jgi:regulator of sirC expression with transglutaminase-like and TPR domain
MHQVLFVDYGFQGAVDNYDHPDNSSLLVVLKKRKGLPIILSHVMVSVAQRIDAPIVGIGVAGRYMVKYDGSQTPDGFAKRDIVINPFEKGRVMSEADLLREWHNSDTAPADARQTLVRMLRNLHSDCIHVGDTQRAQRVATYLQWVAYGGS